MLPEFVLGTRLIKSKKLDPKSHVDAVLNLSWNKLQSNLLLSASADTSIKLWDLNTQQAVYSYQHHDNKVCQVEWHSRQSTILASGGYDQQLVGLDSRAPLELKKFKMESDIESIRWDPFNDDLLYCGTESGMIHLIDMRMGQTMFKLQAHDGASCCLDLNSFHKGLMITASSDQTSKI